MTTSLSKSTIPEYDPNKKWNATIKNARHDLSPLDSKELNDLSNIHNSMFTKPIFTDGQVLSNFEVTERTI